MAEPLNPASVLATRGPLFAATAVISHQLQRAFPASHFQHGMLPAALSRELWLTTIQRTPYVGLTWLGVQPASGAGRLFRGTANWRVVLVNSHPSPAHRIAGDALGPGQFAMVQAAIAALHGHTPVRAAAGGLPADEIDDIGTFMVTEVTALTTEEWGRANDAVAGLVVAADFALTDAANLDTLLRLRGSWAFQPHGAAIASADFDMPPAGGSSQLGAFQLDTDQLG